MPKPAGVKTKITLITSSVPASVAVNANQTKMRTVLSGLGYTFTDLDGAQESNRPERNRLWDISGKRAVYPQLFVNDVFIGEWEALSVRPNASVVVSGYDLTHVQEMIEAGSLKTRIEAAASGKK